MSKKRSTITINLTVKDYKRLAKLLYLGHEIAAAVEEDHSQYDDAANEVFDQAADTELTTLTSFDAIADQADIQEMLTVYHEDIAYKWLAITLAIRDTAKKFDLDPKEELDPANLDINILNFLIKQSSDYAHRLAEEGPDCVQIT